MSADVNYLFQNFSNESPLITINVSGRRYQTQLSTLNSFPDTLLGNENERKRFWNHQQQEYFFDRHRSCFESILHYYQTNGRLRRPDNISLDVFLEEVTFFRLGKTANAQVQESENIEMLKSQLMPKTYWRKVLWCLLTYPESSIYATFIAIITTILTILSCLGLALETLPIFRGYSLNLCIQQANLSSNLTSVPICSDIYQSPFFIIQTICVAYFLIEFILRLISTPSYKRFFFSFFTVVDLAAIIPYLIYVGYVATHSSFYVDKASDDILNILLVLRLFRIFKLFLIFKYLKSMRILAITLKESFADFVGTFSGIVLLGFIFGSIGYVAEMNNNSEVFDSIPRSFYWGLITITTVGYGDMYPTTVIGRIVACTCALSGVATVGILMSVLVDRYQRVYNRKILVTSTDDMSLKVKDDDDQESAKTTQKFIETMDQGILNDITEVILDFDQSLSMPLEAGF